MLTETLSEAVDRLTFAGYEDSFRAEPDGLRAVVAGVLHRPAQALEAFSGSAGTAGLPYRSSGRATGRRRRRLLRAHAR